MFWSCGLQPTANQLVVVASTETNTFFRLAKCHREGNVLVLQPTANQLVVVASTETNTFFGLAKCH